MFSVQAMVSVQALLGSWAALPDDWQSKIPIKFVIFASIASLVLGTIGRLLDQPKVK